MSAFSLPRFVWATRRCRRARLLAGGLGLAGLLWGGTLGAQTWEGPFQIVPASAPDLALEAAGNPAQEGTGVTIGKAAQTWLIVPQANGLYAIRPAGSATLALSVSGGGEKDGTPIILAPESDAAWQRWSIKQNPNGTWSLLPQHAPASALDDFGGAREAGAKQDLWAYGPEDPHLQWMLRPLAGAKMPPVAEIPRATLKEFTFTSSAIFPGTARQCTVLIPAQYDGSKPACVYVQADGYQEEERRAVEALIAAKEMPVTVGVFVQPGVLSAPMKGTAARRNRSFEYDGMGDNYVRFLTEEILPYVAKTFNLNLSASGNDRCIAGGSSGGIQAFNAAWERPDAFSRVYCNSGSFVAFRGGNEFPTMIRQFEPKPIRAYLTAGTHDMENVAGDWYTLNLEIDRALKFSGYDYSFLAIEGPHVVGWNANFAPAMRYLWKDWPRPVQAGAGGPRLRDVVEAGDGWELVSADQQNARSPACNSKGEVFFVDPSSNKIFRVGLDGKIGVFLADAAHANGLAVGPGDSLYTVSQETGNVMCYDAAGHGRVYAGGVRGEQVLALPDRGLYVTSAGDPPGESSKIWFIDGNNKTVVDASIRSAAGLALRSDRWLLAVAEGSSKWVDSLAVKPAGGLADKERFFHLYVADADDDAGPGSVCYAREGQLLVATRSGVQVCADSGSEQEILPLPDRQRVTGVCLGGAGLNTLFAFGNGKVWKRVVKLHAVGAFTPWSPVNGTPL